MRKLESVPGLFMIAASAAVILGTAGLSIWDGITPGARFFPLAVGGAGIVLALLLLWQLWTGADRTEVDRPAPDALMRVGLTVAGLVALAAGAPRIGLVPMLAVFAAFMLLVVLRQRLLPTLATTLVIAGGTHLVFVRWLAVPLPAPLGF